jgi:hypothetical protein
MIKEAIFESYWDGGICVSTSCKVNMDTKEVFDVEMATNVDGLDCLDAEMVVIDDVQYPVFRKEDAGPDNFFYE